jgi:hypothetical protein
MRPVCAHACEGKPNPVLPPTARRARVSHLQPKDKAQPKLIGARQSALDRDKPRQGVVANTLNLFRNGAAGFLDW